LLNKNCSKRKLAGTSALVSSNQVLPDGSKLKQFGANAKGINVFGANGGFFLTVASADNSIGSKDPSSKAKRDGPPINKLGSLP
jgi:hypothetical protein